MPDVSKLPRHVGVIMDGNGRWAKRRGLPRSMGHKPGAEAFGKIAEHADRLGIEYLTAYTFSTENWARPKDEVDTIMNLLREYLMRDERFKGKNLRLRVLGDTAPLDDDLKEHIRVLEERSSGNTGTNVNIAINYGGRAEILRAAKELLRSYSRGEIPDIGALTESDFAAHLYTAGQPDVDLIIRTSGELRSSNFLIWQGAYAEFVFPEVMWPDFSPKHFDLALEEYAGRSRRMGGI